MGLHSEGKDLAVNAIIIQGFGYNSKVEEFESLNYIHGQG
jgi:hypothetical protein